MIQLLKKKGENFDFVYDWTTENDLKKRKHIANNGIELKTTTTKDIEIKSKRKLKEDEKNVEVNNSFNNTNQINNKLNKILNEEENDVIKMEENNIVNDKVDSRCCIM